MKVGESSGGGGGGGDCGGSGVVKVIYFKDAVRSENDSS